MDSYEKIWSSSSEEEVHSCIEDAFTEEGYSCFVMHKKNKRYEEGRDIECEKKGQKIVFTVKKRPRKKDEAQLKKIMGNSSKKIYVYTEEPTRPFFETLTTYEKEGKIEVWNAKKLHEELIKRGSKRYFGKVIKATPLFDTFLSIWFMIYSKRDTKIQRIKKADLDILWKIKDRTSMIHGLFNLMENQYKRKIMCINTIEPREVILITNELLNDLYCVYGKTSDLFEYFNELSKKNPGILSLICSKASGRTGFEIFTRLEQPIHSQNNIYPKDLISFWMIPSTMNSITIYQYLLYALEHLKDNAEKMEWCIDRIFEDWLTHS